MENSVGFRILLELRNDPAIHSIHFPPDLGRRCGLCQNVNETVNRTGAGKL